MLVFAPLHHVHVHCMYVATVHSQTFAFSLVVITLTRMRVGLYTCKLRHYSETFIKVAIDCTCIHNKTKTLLVFTSFNFLGKP